MIREIAYRFYIHQSLLPLSGDEFLGGAASSVISEYSYSFRRECLFSRRDRDWDGAVSGFSSSLSSADGWIALAVITFGQIYRQTARQIGR